VAEAAEVVVGAAFAADAVEGHPSTAVAAVESAAQVVLVLAHTVAAEHRGFEHLLDFLERLAIDDRFVAPFRVLHAIPGDDPCVDFRK
jgi:hypothetical protein